MQIAIDGPAGAGKSSVAREVASRLGIMYLDTGAMYRAITLKALREGIDVTDGKALAELARRCDMEIISSREGGNLVLLDGEDVTEDIRSPQVNKKVSVVARSAELRRELVNLQRIIAAKSNGIVMEGRDIGTNVIPQAEYKFYLHADLEERARRRWLELKGKGLKLSLREIVEEISMRDQIDQEREEAPLKVASDAVVIDTTPYSLKEVIEKVLEYIESCEQKRNPILQEKLKNQRDRCQEA